MKFGGIKSQIYEFKYNWMQELFSEVSYKMRKANLSALDIKIPTWFDHIKRFRQGTYYLENRMKNLIDELFIDIDDVQNGLEILHIFIKFENCYCLQELLCWKLKNVSIVL